VQETKSTVDPSVIDRHKLLLKLLQFSHSHTMYWPNVTVARSGWKWHIWISAHVGHQIPGCWFVSIGDDGFNPRFSTEQYAVTSSQLVSATVIF